MREVHNIAIFGHKRIPSREGGVEIVVEELGTRLVQKGYHVTCFNRRGHHVSGAQFDKKAVHEYKGIDIRYVFTIEKNGLCGADSIFFSQRFEQLQEIMMWYISMRRDQRFSAGCQTFWKESSLYHSWDRLGP